MGLGLGSIAGALNPTGLIGTVAGGLIGGVSDIYSANKIAQGQQDTNNANLTSAREQMAFQRDMSNTSHQREVADLKAAGINPVLSANSGASTPVGSSATFSNAAPDYRGIANKVAGTAIDLKNLQLSASKIDQDIQESKSRVGANNATTINTLANADSTKTGWISKFIGSDASSWLKRLLEAGFHSAKDFKDTMSLDTHGAGSNSKIKDVSLINSKKTDLGGWSYEYSGGR